MDTKQLMEFLLKNVFIYCNYENEVDKHNSRCRNYIRTPKKIYEDRILNYLHELFDGKSEEEILQIFSEFCDP